MRTYSPLYGALFIIECARFSFLTGLLAILRHSAGTVFPWQIYAVPNALFVLITLFLWLDNSKYALFSLLYISGKALCLFSETISGISLIRSMGAMSFFETGISNPGIVLPFVFGADLITLIIIFFGFRKYKKNAPELNSAAPDTDAQDSGGQGAV